MLHFPLAAALLHFMVAVGRQAGGRSPPSPSLLQQMPVAQMPDIKGKSSAQDSATRLLDSATRHAAAVKLKHQLKHFGITLHQQNILYIYTIYHNIVCHAICMFNGGKLKVIVTFLQHGSVESVCLRLGLKLLLPFGSGVKLRLISEVRMCRMSNVWQMKVTGKSTY